MIDISFEIGGRKVNPNQIGDALEKAVLQGPEHGGKLIPMKSNFDYKLELIDDDLKQGGKKL